jgi:hypothetical protein
MSAAQSLSGHGGPAGGGAAARPAGAGAVSPKGRPEGGRAPKRISAEGSQ